MLLLLALDALFYLKYISCWKLGFAIWGFKLESMHGKNETSRRQNNENMFSDLKQT